MIGQEKVRVGFGSEAIFIGQACTTRLCERGIVDDLDVALAEADGLAHGGGVLGQLPQQQLLQIQPRHRGSHHRQGVKLTQLARFGSGCFRRDCHPCDRTGGGGCGGAGGRIARHIVHHMVRHIRCHTACHTVCRPVCHMDCGMACVVVCGHVCWLAYDGACCCEGEGYCGRLRHGCGAACGAVDTRDRSRDRGCAVFEGIDVVSSQRDAAARRDR